MKQLEIGASISWNTLKIVPSPDLAVKVYMMISAYVPIGTQDRLL